jgi:diguanylate cyclase (GGDEF)-like protein
MLQILQFIAALDPTVLAFTHASVITILAAYLMWRNRRLAKQVEKLAALASASALDALTGLHTRAALTHWARTQSGAKGVVVVIDINDFKTINDTLGHQAGDQVIAGVGRLVGASIREGDFACRYGGDEFVIIFTNDNLDNARTRMKRVEERLAQFRLRSSGLRHPVRISWGVADIGTAGLFEAIHTADELMYRQKAWRKQVSASNAQVAAAVGS